MNDALANILSKINTAEKKAKKECVLTVSSNLVQDVLKVLKENSYIGDIEKVENSRGFEYKINLLGKINNCSAIKPRFAVTIKDFDKFEKRFLPAMNFGIIIISTSKGVMTLEKARKNNLGGRLIAFCY